MLKLLGYDKYQEKLSTKDKIASVLVFLFYFSFLLLNQIRSAYTTYFWYLVIIAGIFFAFAMRKWRLNWKILVYLGLSAGTAGLNILFTGNSSFDSQAYTVLCIGITLLLIQHKINTNYLLTALYMNILVVLFRIFTGGGIQSYMKIYVTSSSNFVSVHLLFVAVIYYAVLEQQGRRIPFVPALATWIVCVMAMGRGGILSASVLMVGLVLYFRKTRFRNMKAQNRMCTILIIFIALIAAVPYVISIIMANMSTSVLLERFSTFGMSDNGRFPCWIEYITACFGDLKSFLLGASFSELKIVTRYGDNLHNSFLNIHAFNGMIMFVYIIILCIKAVFYAKRHHKMLFFWCFVTLCLRGATDYVFWHTNGTPIFLYFLFVPLMTPRLSRLRLHARSNNP